MISQPPAINPVVSSTAVPKATEVVVIGGGIIGLTAALTLAERGIPVTVLEKGRLAGEQSSRNLGWVRKTNRAALDLPLSIAADRLWAEMPQRTGKSVGFRQSGIMFTARTEAELSLYSQWYENVGREYTDAQMLSGKEIASLVPGGRENWLGGIYTASDACAEPTMAASAIANAAIAKGAVIVENCAARSLSTSGGRVSGVVTEHGEIACQQVILASGLWSRRFLGNMGIDFPMLPLTVSVLRTVPMNGPTEIAVGGPNFSFRKDHTGGYTIMHRAALVAPITLDSVLLGPKYISSLKAFWKAMRLELGSELWNDIRTPRKWRNDAVTPFEATRTKNPDYNPQINAEAMRNVAAAWPAFSGAPIAMNWAGMMDMTPDSLPVIDNVEAVPGLSLATGFSGHGFGCSPAAGQLAAEIATGATPIVDPSPYRWSRFS
ncbi:NAD(P)/FAD-dependent oxidoreductase [Aurantiacibacter suaedae]|uniref:NAD(P)/FAD-dependent oxidoreductase n=1 Tax=Aurantiacibacter suaedae TaxID=2545755 RepID=UPI001F4F66C4|nr:FAD-binding oxidoreductase [Aurantiacibacter suaedae]